MESLQLHEGRDGYRQQRGSPERKSGRFITVTAFPVAVYVALNERSLIRFSRKPPGLLLLSHVIAGARKCTEAAGAAGS